MLGLHYCPKLSLGAVSGWVFFVVVLRHLTAVAWVLQAHGLAELGPPGTWACRAWSSRHMGLQSLVLQAHGLAELGPPGTWASVAVVCGLHSCGSQALELGLSSCFAWA